VTGTHRGAILSGLVALGVIYAGLMAVIPPGAFFSGDEGIKWLQVDSLRRHGWTSLAIDPPGGELDPAGDYIPAFLIRAHGEVRSIFPALMPALASVPYALAGSRAIYVVPALAALLCLVAAARLAQFVLPHPWAAVAGIASVAATPLVFYGATFWEHSLAVMFCVAAMIPLCKLSTGSGAAARFRMGLAAGLLLGCAALARTECALMVPAVAAAGMMAWGAAVFAAPALALTAAAGIVQIPRILHYKSVFGSWMPPHLMANMPGGALGRATRAPGAVAAELLGPAGWRILFAATAAAGLALWIVSRLLRGRAGHPAPSRGSKALMAAGIALSLVLLCLGPLSTLAVEFSSQPISTHDRGYQSLLHTMPLLALLPTLIVMAPGPRHPHRLFLAWSAALYIALVVLLAPVEGGLQWGPRLLLPAVPLVTIAMLAVLIGQVSITPPRVAPGGRLAADGRLAPGGRLTPGRHLAMTGVIAALALGLLMQGIGLRFLVAVRSYNARMLETVRSAVSPGDVILSDFFAVPQLLTTLSSSNPILYLKPGSDLDTLSARLDAMGARPFWIARRRPAAGGHAIDLGGGLSLVGDEGDAGVRGFLRPPRGD